jgi:3-hydroxyisobutyrate dehydrogenase-like beta-hydroxyacid dehydrogenase
MTERVGFIGVGRMGAPMVRRLLAHGYEVALRDVNAAALTPFRGQPGVTIADSPYAVAAAVPVVLLSLPKPELLDEVVLGTDGIASANPPVTVIDLSTSGMSATRRVASAAKTRGLRFLDAPVSGGVTGAETGTLAVMVAGDPDLHNRHRALLSVIGRNVFHVGAEPGHYASDLPWTR